MIIKIIGNAGCECFQDVDDEPKQAVGAYTFWRCWLGLGDWARCLSSSIIVIALLIVYVRKGPLDNDVASLNRTIKSYIVKGGNISLATVPQEVVAILQTTASNDRSITDYRLPITEDLSEIHYWSLFFNRIKSYQGRLACNPHCNKAKFVFYRSGSVGVKRG